ncbi:MAG: hypothetical protein FWD06_04985 [Oscillospiraceae bacterium]|nr:hypothetical protein [Oscillospiraceae bacterium]
MTLEIDKFTPCLEDARTGEILPTIFTPITRTELENLQGWGFEWGHPNFNDDEIYKLMVKGDPTIQGVIAIQNNPRNTAMFVHAAEAAPHNLGVNRQYDGVGGHLFAIAARRSVEEGNQGYLYFDAKNERLARHYERMLGAQHIGIAHPFRMEVDVDRAIQLLERYIFEEG